MKYLVIVSGILIMFSGCNQGGNNPEANLQNAEVVSLTKLADEPETVSSDVISVKGMVTHVCKHGGQKMFITNESQDKKIMVRVSQSIPEFAVTMEGSTVEVTGKLKASISTKEKESEQTLEGETEECTEEDALKSSDGDNSSNTTTTYYVEAVSFVELTK